MKTSIAALGAALCAGCAALPASAGIALGAFASTTDAVTQQYAEDSAPGAGPGSYRASVAGASADLSWGAAGCAFTGEATGGNGITARSRGVAILVFGDDTLFTISWSMAQCVGCGGAELRGRAAGRVRRRGHGGQRVVQRHGGGGHVPAGDVGRGRGGRWTVRLRGLVRPGPRTGWIRAPRGCGAGRPAATAMSHARGAWWAVRRGLARETS